MLKRRLLSILLVLAMLVPTAFASQPAQDNMRGVWVASVYNIDYPSNTGLSADALAAEADTMLDNIAAMGLGTVFLQVRPSADALYKSSLFPQSRYVSGACGAAPDGNFDVLAYWVEGAHKRGLQLHAWVNPYRITKDGKDELDALPESSPARQHPEWVVQYENNYYFDPGLPAVQQARRKSSVTTTLTASTSTTTSIPARISTTRKPTHATAKSSTTSTTGGATT